ncbi:hypothetical protein CAEBREN_01085 [Caenorhabditis brenneri]|uniref:SPK domain-containing protein n=1 Tax=Caenorhabditis brenneri TaxID=135651 RepID=G0NJZ1_CAEBE|nr:hypothetical protein CAEBREN_01085 [Caenorhabditis brenneri]
MTEQQIIRDQENHFFLNFVGGKCEETETPLIIKAVIDEYMSSGTSLTFGALRKCVDDFKTRICQLKELEVNSKVKLLYGLSVSVNVKCLKELRNVAHVDIDKRRRITKYIANDGSLRLEGSHVKSFQTMKTVNTEPDEEEKECERETTDVAPVPKRSRKERSADEPILDLVASDNDENRQVVTIGGKPPKQQHQNVIAVKPEVIDEPTLNVAINKKDHSEHLNRKRILPLAARKEFLYYLLDSIKLMNLPVNENMLARLNGMISNIEEFQKIGLQVERKVEMVKFHAIVLSAVTISVKNASEQNHEDTGSLREFLMLMEMGVMSLELPELQELQMKINESLNDPANQNKRIHVRSIEKALETILEIFVTKR